MKFFVETLAVALFVLAYFFYPDMPEEWIAFVSDPLDLELQAHASGDRIYFATIVLMVAMLIQCGAMQVMQQLRPIHLAALVVVWIAGSLTLLLKDPMFIIWKPTVFYWAMALAFVGVSLFSPRTLVERMLAHSLPLTDPRIWQRLNLAWIGFFTLCGALNLYVAYAYSEEFWVQFKLFGLALGLPLVFLLIQIVYLSRHVRESNS